jgi:endothelin-converting enzyme
VLTKVQKYYNPMLIDEAAAIAPEIELKALLDGLAPAKSKIDRVIVMAPKYLKELSVILAATDKDVLQSYFVWKAVQSMSSYVDTEAVKPYKRFRNVLAGKVCTPEAQRSITLLTIIGPRIST